VSGEREDELAERLFDAARRERPSARARAQVIELGLRSLAVRRSSRLRVTLALVAAACIGLFAVLRVRSPEPLIGAERLPPSAARASEETGIGRANVTRMPASGAPVEPAASAAAPIRRAPSVATALPPTAPLRTLEQETAALGRVEEELRAGRADSALALLDHYQRAAPAGSLAAEATLLRIRALSKNGQAKAAGELAQKFVSSYPNSPLVDRAREYLPAADAGDARETDLHLVEKTGGVR
jgi:hypothetical protein